MHWLGNEAKIVQSERILGDNPRSDILISEGLSYKSCHGDRVAYSSCKHAISNSRFKWYMVF